MNHIPSSRGFIKATTIILVVVGLVSGVFNHGYAKDSDAPDESRTSSFSFSDLGMEDRIIDQVFDQYEVHFKLAEGLIFDQAFINLHLEHSQQLLPELSDLVLALNGQPVIDLVLDEHNWRADFYPVQLPTNALQTGDNSLMLRFKLRLVDSGCSDVGDSSLWAKVYEDTRIDLTTSEAAIHPDLSRYPAPFNTLSSLAGSPQLAFVFPDEPTTAELSAAARIAASLGQSSGWDEPPMISLTASQLTLKAASAYHLVVINLAGRNPLAAPDLNGVSETVSPFNPNRLMVTVSGMTGQILLQAAEILATRSSQAEIDKTRPAVSLVNPLPLGGPSDIRTFSDLGLKEWHIEGIGLHDIYYPITIPYDWKVTSEATIELFFTHARDLDTRHSQLDVYVNGSKVTDISMNNRNAGDGRLTINLSPRQLHQGQNWLHLSIEMHLQNEDCRYRYLNESWFSISTNDSTINLAHVTSQPPTDLRYFPSMLVTPADLSADLFVLPDKPLASDLTALVKLAAKLGTYVQADSLHPEVVTAIEFKSQERDRPHSNADEHIIIVGTPQSNSVLARYDDQFPQPLNLQAGAVVPVLGRELLPEEIASPGEALPSAGYLQLLPAPWSHQAVVLVVAGFDTDGLARVVGAVPTANERFRIHGNVAIITPGQTVGITSGGLIDYPLSIHTRILLAAVLIFAFVLSGIVGWFIYHQKMLSSARQTANEDEEL